MDGYSPHLSCCRSEYEHKSHTEFADNYKYDENGLVDLEYNKRRTIHFFGQEWWDQAMAALEAAVPNEIHLD